MQTLSDENPWKKYIESAIIVRIGSNRFFQLLKNMRVFKCLSYDYENFPDDIPHYLVFDRDDGIMLFSDTCHRDYQIEGNDWPRFEYRTLKDDTSEDAPLWDLVATKELLTINEPICLDKMQGGQNGLDITNENKAEYMKTIGFLKAMIEANE